MARTLQIRKPTAREIPRLEAVLESECAPQVLRRAHVLLQYADGLQGTEMARALGVPPKTLYADLHAFDETALAGLAPLPHGGAPSHFTSEQVDEIVRLALASPQECGRLEARWPRSNFCAFLPHRRHLVARIRREHLRRILKKRTFASARCGANASAMIHRERRF